MANSARKPKPTARPGGKASAPAPTRQRRKLAPKSRRGIRLKQPRPPFRKAKLPAPPGREKDLSPRPRYEAPAYRAAGKLEGKVALITGGDSGIGRAIALLYAREGADIAVVYLNEHADAEETQAAVAREGRRCMLIAGDVTDPDFCRDAVERVIAQFGGLDILVNNAAWQQSRDSLEELSIEDWDRTFKTNIYGYFYMAKAALPHLRSGSVILNTGSITGFEGSASLLDYSSTKGAIHAFTKSLAQSLLDRGIRVNAVAPGPVWTPLNPADQGSDAKNFGADVPMKRPAQPEELAPTYVFLASEADSSYITGEVIPVLGGETIAG